MKKAYNEENIMDLDLIKVILVNVNVDIFLDLFVDIFQ